MDLILSVILIVFGVLQIVLFFKIWGMTNDIRKIKEKYLGDIIQKDIVSQKSIVEVNPKINNSLYNIGDRIIILKTGKEATINSIDPDNDVYECHYGGGVIFDGKFETFKGGEIKKA